MKHNLDSMIGRFRDELLANFRTGYDDDEEVVLCNAFKKESSKRSVCFSKFMKVYPVMANLSEGQHRGWKRQIGGRGGAAHKK